MKISLQNASRAGIVCVCALILSAIAPALTTGLSLDAAAVINVLLYAVVCATYLMVLLGAREVANIHAVPILVTRMNQAIIAGAVVWVAFIPTYFAHWMSIWLQLLIFPAMLVLVAILGIFSLRLVKGYNSLSEKVGKNASRAALWHQISGWFMVSVVGAPVGVFLSLIADYYMWALVREELRRSS